MDGAGADHALNGQQPVLFGPRQGEQRRQGGLRLHRRGKACRHRGGLPAFQ
jgi:hypothetical protein